MIYFVVPGASAKIVHVGWLWMGKDFCHVHYPSIWKLHKMEIHSYIAWSNQHLKANNHCLDDLFSSDYNTDGDNKRNKQYYAWQVAGMPISCNQCNQVKKFRFNEV